jgi:hypothetical protein
MLIDLAHFLIFFYDLSLFLEFSITVFDFLLMVAYMPIMGIPTYS